MTAASTAGVKKPQRSRSERHSGYPTHLTNWACEARPVEIRVVAIGCSCMVRDGGWVVNSKGQLELQPRLIDVL